MQGQGFRTPRPNGDLTLWMKKLYNFFAENLFLQQKPRWAGQVREGKMVAGGWMDGIKKEEGTKGGLRGPKK